ncbi:MAG: phosphoribosyltransferase [Treponema sp.]|nr:phosphoribosyltransferase [Treponema sp.]
MRKEFLQFDVARDNAIKLAHQIFSDGFVPDVIYVSLRGGAYLANIISEYFKIVHTGARPVYYAAVVARSYSDVAKSDQVKVDGWTYSPDYLRVGDKVLLIDDIFDSGKTINYLAQIILDKGIPRKDLKVAVHDYKYFKDKETQLPVQPDYWCRKHEVSIHDDVYWIHYMSHELMGLTETELEENYYKRDPELRKALKVITELPSKLSADN